MPLCPQCSSSLPSVSALWLHLSLSHKADRFSNFRCREGDCLKLFSNWSTFKKHIIKYHPADLENDALNIVNSEEIDVNANVASQAIIPEESVLPVEIVTPPLCLLGSVKKSILQFLAKLPYMLIEKFHVVMYKRYYRTQEIFFTR